MLRMARQIVIPSKVIHSFLKNIQKCQVYRVGGKIGFDQSAYTLLQSKIRALVAYDKAMGEKTQPRPQKRPQTQFYVPSYYSMNGERDNNDYEWEVDESIIRRAVNESLNKLGLLSKESRL